MPFRVEVAQYYCELAMNFIIAQNANAAHSQLTLALDANKNCIRANVLLGDIENSAGQYQTAISDWKLVEFQQPDYLGLVAGKMLKSYCAADQLKEGLAQLNSYIETYKLPSLMSVLYEATLTEEGAQSAAKLARNELIRQPSLNTLDQLLQARAMADDVNNEDVQLMQQTVRNAIGNRAAYHCNQCGFRAKQYHWQCPACNAWESLPAEPSETIVREMTVRKSNQK